jgi:hypothetical protein
MMNIIKADFPHYNNGDHLECHKVLYPVCVKYSEIINAPELISAYNTKVIQEENIYSWMRNSEFTAKKAEADHARDIALSGLSSLVKANLKHFNIAIRDNAIHVDHLLKSYGNIIALDYDGETATIESLIARLNSPTYLPAVQNLNLGPWITELTNQNNLFKSYVNVVNQEHLTKPSIKTVTARRETDAAYKNIVTRITAFIALNGETNYVALVNEINVILEHYKILVHEHYGRIHAKTDISDGIIVPVDVQHYTGKPVYVIPTVSIVKTAKDGTQTVVELVFNKDYNVSYKNNVNPGTATLTITGIGKYVGTIVTTFNISEEIEN